jgi:Recombination endonuclease VII
VFSFRDWSATKDDKDLERVEKRRASRRRYSESHKEQIKEYRRRKWETDLAYREKQRVRSRRSQRRTRFRKIYGISEADYEVMFARQRGACAICKRTGERLCVDHCHLIRRVRSLLCIKCNSGLGFFNDDRALLLAAAAYLQTHATRNRRSKPIRCASAKKRKPSRAHADDRTKVGGRRRSPARRARDGRKRSSPARPTPRATPAPRARCKR